MAFNDQLKDVTLKGVVRANKDLGRGSYCKVFAVKYCGLLCAAKEIHPILTEGVSKEDKQAIKSLFVRECHQCSVIRHPNIVQFIGVWYSSERSDLPIMVMELMDQSLTSFIDKKVAKVSIDNKISILHDISLGLSYLHARDPPIVHRDLSSNNILLTDHLRAKISDLGLAKIIEADFKRTPSKLTTTPGTLFFMPPETFVMDNPVYGTPVDVFSFAVIAVHIFSEEWPTPAPAVKQDATTKSLIALSEKERRQRYLDKMMIDAMLKKLVENCLQNDPNDRPVIEDVCEKIEHLKEAEMKDGQPSKKVEVSTPVAPHVKKEDFSVSPSDYKMQRARDPQAKEYKMQQAKDQKAEEQKMQQVKAAAKAAVDQPVQVSASISPPVVPEVKKQDVALHHQDVPQVMHMEPPPVVEALQRKGHSITWMALANLPYSFYDASVAVDGENVYVTAGGAPSSIIKDVVYYYDIGTDKWNTLPKPDHDCGILQMVGGMLVIFGGEDPVNYTVLNKVSTYNKYSKRWYSYIPDMINRRFLPGVTVYQEYVIAMGGLRSLDNYYDSIEMLNWQQQQPFSWIQLSINLPNPMGAIKPTISGKHLVIIGYEQKGFRYNSSYQIPLDALKLSYNQKQQSGDNLWEDLPGAPYYFTATVPYSNPTLIVGGDVKNVPTSDICYLDTTKNAWVKVNSLHSARKQVGVAAINSTTIIVIGGSNKGGSSEANKASSLPTVEIGYILPNN